MRARLLVLAGVLLLASDAGAARPSPFVPQAIAFWDATHGIATFGSCGMKNCLGRIETTTDGGRTWKLRWQEPRLGDIAVARGSRDAWVETSRGLMHSADGGRSWMSVPAGPDLAGMSFPTRTVGFAFRVRPRTGEIGPLVRSGDAGRTWTKVGGPCTRAVDGTTAFDSASFGRVLCTSEPAAGNQLKWLYETRDRGRSWRLLAGSGRTQDHELCSCGYAGEIAFAGSFGLLVQHRAWSYRSTDGGRTWRPLRVTSPDVIEGDDAAVLSETAGYLLRARFGRYEELLRTDDGGRTWRLVRHWSALG